ncbi:unnamed protein product [Phytophthora lilii]|uniref:Unnamed protein product n=1 Tax=Phytophthora lilii TaxID=2077276 RepID=A0A9W6WW65_9STRA|nr:unnamed protein product [Phytophthora lilii]
MASSASEDFSVLARGVNSRDHPARPRFAAAHVTSRKHDRRWSYPVPIAAASIELPPPIKPSKNSSARRSAQPESAGAGTATPQAGSTAQPAPFATTTRRRSPRLLQQRARDGDTSRGGSASVEANLYRLVASRIVKQTVSQREATGEVLGIFAVGGSTFSDIIKKLWEKYCERMRGIAVEVDGEWSIVEPDRSEWGLMMQFKCGRHLVDGSMKTEQAWNKWMASKPVREEGVKLPRL